MRRLILIFIILTAASHGFAFDHTYKNWDTFLKKHVVVKENSSQVKYSSALSDRSLLDSFVNEVQALKKSEYEKWSAEQRQAFLFNAYNALTIKLILDNKIPASIKDLGGFMSSPWRKKFFKIFGADAYLDKIEHEMARKEFNNCRFHFAFNCASVGCPMLRNEAWRPERLNAQLEDAAAKFVSDSSRNRYNSKKERLELSKIFDWYGKDFQKDKTCGGSVQAFVAKYLQVKGASPIDIHTGIDYQDYDWKLNKAAE